MKINFLQYWSKWLAVKVWTKTYESIDPYQCCLFQRVMSKTIYMLPSSKGGSTSQAVSHLFWKCLGFWQLDYKMGKWGALPLRTHRHSCPCVWEGPVVPLLLSVQTHRWSLILVLCGLFGGVFKQIALTWQSEVRKKLTKRFSGFHSYSLHRRYGGFCHTEAQTGNSGLCGLECGGPGAVCHCCFSGTAPHPCLQK